MTSTQGTDAATRALSAEEREKIMAVRTLTDRLYRGKDEPRHSCTSALAVAFGLAPRPYQALRKGGLTGERMCGSMRGGDLILGELLGPDNGMGPVTEEWRAATIWYQEQIPKRFETGETGTYVCKTLTDPLGDFFGPRRKDYCVKLTAEIAALVMESVLRFAPDKAPKVMEM
jgi:hypothetical protein